jgi:hypothetical protein
MKMLPLLVVATAAAAAAAAAHHFDLGSEPRKQLQLS